MKDHFVEKHPEASMSQALAEEVALRYHEKEGTLQLLDKPSKSVKVQCTAQCACKTTPFVM